MYHIIRSPVIFKAVYMQQYASLSVVVDDDTANLINVVFVVKSAS